MSQQYEISRKVHELTTFSASSQQSTKNPISFGLDEQMRIDYLSIQIVGTLNDAAATASTLDINTAAERDDLYDAILSQVRLYSSPLGDVIRTLSLSELAKMVQFVNADFCQSDLPRPGQSKTCKSTGVYEFILQLDVPFRLDNASQAALYAPRVAQFPDGGLSFKTGGGSASLNSVTWNVDSSTTIEFRMLGPIVSQQTKVSPLLYEKLTTSTLTPEFQSGMYFTLLNNTDAPTTAYGTGGASAGVRVMVDGITITDMNDYDPLVEISGAVRNSADPSAFDLDCAFTDDASSHDGGTFMWDRVGTPIWYTSYRARSYNFHVVQDRVVLNMGSNWTASADWLINRVRPLDEVGDVPGCRCAAKSGIVIGPPGETSGQSASIANVFNPRLEKV